MALASEIAAVARLELAEVVRSRWLLVCLGLYGLVAALFVLVGLRESSVIGFTGMGRVLFSLCHALVLLLPLLALAVTGQAVNRARDDGTLELWMSQPIRRTSYYAAVVLVRYLALALPLLALLAGLALLAWIAWGEPLPWRLLVRTASVSACLLWAFVALGLATSVRVRSPARAMTCVIVFWAAAVALVDFALIGMMLSWRLQPAAVFLLAALNPVQAARLALLSAAEPELATLGPVGFFLANRFGPAALYGLGVAWPALFGAAACALGLRWFRRGDLV
jgi:ABC-type transport system involved in multi-copper enzyme maturation permease subunit